MQVQLGNIAPKNVNHSDPVVSYVTLGHDDTFDPNMDVEAFRAHVEQAYLYNDGVTNYPGSEALLDIVAPGAVWAQLSSAKPSWVDSDNADLARVLAAWFGCPLGRPSNTEATHWTHQGPPGVGVENASPALEAALGITSLLVNTGNDIVSKSLGGGGIYTSGTRTSTGTGTTSLTDSGASFSTSLVGQIVVAGSVYGVIESATSTVLTIDRWYNFATPGGAAGSTPGATTAYVVVAGCAPALFMALSTTNSAPAAGDTTMAGEITTAGGGLIRAIATYAHSASATTYTLANTFTSNGTDSLPATVYRIGVFISMVNGWANSMMLETTLNASATLTTSGDAITVTDTVTV